MRSRVNNKKSRSEFNKRQAKTHKKNMHMSYRGGIRL